MAQQLIPPLAVTQHNSGRFSKFVPHSFTQDFTSPLNFPFQKTIHFGKKKKIKKKTLLVSLQATSKDQSQDLPWDNQRWAPGSYSTAARAAVALLVPL